MGLLSKTTFKCIALFCTFLCSHCMTAKTPDFALYRGRKQATFSLPSPSPMLKFPILASWVHYKLPKCSYLGIRTLWANCFMTFLMRSMRQVIIAHAQSNMRQCLREMGAYQLHKPPMQVESLLSGRSHTGKPGDPGDEVGGNLVRAHNTQRATSPLSPHLAYATAFL